MVGDWNTHPRADALSIRLCGALHAAALSGRDPALAAEYPEQRASWNIGLQFPAGTKLIGDHREDGMDDYLERRSV